MDFTIRSDNIRLRVVTWKVPDDRVKGAWANDDDATRDGAYSVCLATIEVERGWVAKRRAETRTGADYYVGPADGPDDFESLYRAEISGTDSDDAVRVDQRLKQKVKQARAGHSNLPAFAAVVGFGAKVIALSPVVEADDAD